MRILGISCYFHDAAAALISDGRLVAAAEEERFSRKKHDAGFPKLAIEFCLKRAGITARELDYVVFYERPVTKLDRILKTHLQASPQSWAVFSRSMPSWLGGKMWVRDQIINYFRIAPEKVLFTDHHISHAASAFFCSPFEESAILTLDGAGEWTTAAMGTGSAAWNGSGRNTLQLTSEIRFPHSLGLLYSAFTAFLGFEVNEGEYKVMGMAPYGTPRYVDRIYKVIHVEKDGSFWLDMSYFAYHNSLNDTFTSKFLELFGEPRDPKSEFVTRQTHADISGYESVVERNQYYADVAASIQRVTEDVILAMANEVQRRTGSKRLCMAGGVALNSVANGRILRETPFEEIYIHPAAGDSGGAVGAALYAYHVLLGRPRQFVMEHAYWGEEYSQGDVRAFLQSQNIPYEVLDDEKMTDRVADALTRGKVAGWFQGRFEWGPRALGNRSIVADPRTAEMKNIVNRMIKFREPFRPFAPAILEEAANDYFVFDATKQFPARYMLLVLPIREEKQAEVPAVNHMGTGRLQTVRPEWNARYYSLIEKFGQATGVPVIMNTSFNLRGEPIVTTPANAMNTFRSSGLDLLVLEDCLISKEKMR